MLWTNHRCFNQNIERAAEFLYIGVRSLVNVLWKIRRFTECVVVRRICRLKQTSNAVSTRRAFKSECADIISNMYVPFQPPSSFFYAWIVYVICTLIYSNTHYRIRFDTTSLPIADNDSKTKLRASPKVPKQLSTELSNWKQLSFEVVTNIGVLSWLRWRILARERRGAHQCCRFSRNIAEVTSKIIYFYYLKKKILGQSIQKINNTFLKKEALVPINLQCHKGCLLTARGCMQLATVPPMLRHINIYRCFKTGLVLIQMKQVLKALWTLPGIQEP